MHSSDPNVVHFCGHPCPACGYQCTRIHGHDGRHDTVHGEPYAGGSLLSTPIYASGLCYAGGPTFPSLPFCYLSSQATW